MARSGLRARKDAYLRADLWRCLLSGIGLCCPVAPAARHAAPLAAGADGSIHHAAIGHVTARHVGPRHPIPHHAIAHHRPGPHPVHVHA